MTNTDTIIFSRPGYPLSITYPFLLYLPPSQSITIYIYIYIYIYIVLYIYIYIYMPIGTHLVFPEYLAKSIIIQSSNISSRKCYIMKLVKR